MASVKHTIDTVIGAELSRPSVDTQGVRDGRWAAMGGTARVRIVGGHDEMLHRARLWTQELEMLWSRFIESSEVSRLNSGGGRRRVRPETARLVSGMVEAWQCTQGSYDPTLLPALIELGYATSMVDPRRITVLSPHRERRGDPGGIVVEGRWVELPEGTTIDPGGIGKGLAADIVAERLIDDGAAGCLVELSGDLRVMGTPPDDSAWRIAIEDPFDADLQRGIIRLSDGGVATSSQRKRRWSGPDGIQRHHLLNPASSQPAVTSIQSATVLATSAMRAEYLTKPCFVQSPEEALSALPRWGAAAMLIDHSGVELVSDNWKVYS